MNPEDKTPGEVPPVDHKPIPAWIKLMWLFAVGWMLTYVLMGLRSTPTGW